MTGSNTRAKEQVLQETCVLVEWLTVEDQSNLQAGRILFLRSDFV